MKPILNMFDYLRIVSPTIVGIIVVTIYLSFLEHQLLDEILTMELPQNTAKEVQKLIPEFSPDDLRMLLQAFTEGEISRAENLTEMKKSFAYMSKGMWMLPIWLLFCQLLYVILHWRIRDPNRTAVAYFIGFNLTLPIFGFVFALTRGLEDAWFDYGWEGWLALILGTVAILTIYLRHMRILCLIYCLVMLAGTTMYVFEGQIVIHVIMLCFTAIDATIAVFVLTGKDHAKSNLDNSLEVPDDVLTHQ